MLDRHPHHRPRGVIEELGCRVSSLASDISAHPFAQIGVIAVCALWFAAGYETGLLTAVLSILAITLAQMVLNRQNEREADAHRRDVALHAKIDELVIAVKGARDEMAGIEDLDEREIVELKDEVKKAINRAGAAVGDSRQRAEAKRAAGRGIEREVAEKRAKQLVRP